jgi:arylsulfatase A-like enzyme
MSRHFVWLIPATDLLIFLALGLVLSISVACWPRRGSWLATRVLCALSFLSLFWTALPWIYGPAAFLLALGVAARLVPVLERPGVDFGRWVKISLLPLACLLPLLTASVWGADRFKEWSEASRPLPPPGSPNVLFIVLDTVAAGHLSLHGYERPTSPTLDGLARRGIRFDRVQATSSWTLPSLASAFTGLWPHELSVGWLTPLDAAHPTLAEYLGSHGYATSGFVANTFYCGTDTGLNRGFTHYRDYIFPELSAFKWAALVHRPLEGIRSIHDFARTRLNAAFLQGLLVKFDAGNRKPAAAVNHEFLDWLSLRRQPERPFFAFLNYYDAHYPYKLPEGSIHRFGASPRTEREIELIEYWRAVDKRRLSLSESAFVRASYDDCIADLDEQLGRLIDELDRRNVLDKTWLIITADHGESFGEHPGVFGHGTSLYQTQLHVPLVIVPPGRGRAPQVVSETVSLRDLSATIAEALNLETGAPFPGESLARFWGVRSTQASGDRLANDPALSVVVHTNSLEADPARLLANRQVWACLAEENWVYIRHEGEIREELYDLREDPKQLHDLSTDLAMQARLERMRAKLHQMTGGPLTRERLNP